VGKRELGTEQQVVAFVEFAMWAAAGNTIKEHHSRGFGSKEKKVKLRRGTKSVGLWFTKNP